MRKISWTLLLTSAVLCSANAEFVRAQTAAPSTSSTRNAVKTTAPNATGKATVAPTYAQLKRSLKIDPAVSLDVVRADQASYAGRAIEFAGFVTGTFKANGVQTVVLNVDNSVVNIQTTGDILNGALLQSGANVRILALVGKSDANASNESSAVSLQPLAVTSAPRPPVSSDVSAPNSVSYALDDLPAASEIPLVQSARGNNANAANSSRVPRASSTRSAKGLPASSVFSPSIVAGSTAAAAAAQDNSSDFDSQMPAYRAMVKRFNRKLRDDIVEKIASSLLQAGAANGMDPRFLAAIISVESDFDIYCRSSSGAMGLGQIMPFNLKEAQITNAWDPVQNVWGTARLLRGHLNDYRNRADGTLLAVAAYNAGPGAVRRAGYRVPSGSQVQRYVWKVYNRYKEFAPDMFPS